MLVYATFNTCCIISLREECACITIVDVYQVLHRANAAFICAAVFFRGAFFVRAFFVASFFVGAFLAAVLVFADLRGGALLLTRRDISQTRFDEVLRLPPYSGQDVGSSASWMPTFRTRAVTSSQRRRISILRF